jgi:hypothetical protein
MKQPLTKELMTYVNVPDEGEEHLHNLWSTPVIMAKPFSKEFIKQLTQDVEYLTKKEGAGRFNQTDLWTLPDLPDTMIAVKEKIMQMAETAFRPDCEMPLPPFRVAKGYFRLTDETWSDFNQIYICKLYLV